MDQIMENLPAFLSILLFGALGLAFFWRRLLEIGLRSAWSGKIPSERPPASSTLPGPKAVSHTMLSMVVPASASVCATAAPVPLLRVPVTIAVNT